MQAGAHSPDLLAPLFSDPDVAALFSDTAELAALVEVEQALARAQGALGIVPAEAADRIVRALSGFVPDLAELTHSTAQSGLAVVGLVAQLRAHVGGDAAAYVHWGATSQDILDTGLVLRLRGLLDLLDRRLEALSAALGGLADSHRDTIMAGRTRYLQALPVTFGLKAAGWLAPLLRHRQRLAELKPRLQVVQFGGAAGTLAVFGDRGVAVMERLAAELDLGVPPMPWHAQRDTLAELAAWLSLVTGALGKIGQDVALMAQSEVGELREGGETRGGSSTLPQKANPIAAETLVTLARLNAGLLGTMHQALVQEHERGAPGWAMEWQILPQMALTTGAALRHGLDLVTNLQVDPARMSANVAASNGLLLAEAAAFALARHMPRAEAQMRVKNACREAADTDRHLMEVLADSTDAPVDWAALKDPANYLGAAGAFVDRVLRAAATSGGR